VKPRDAVSEALERVVRPFTREGGDWGDVLRRAGEPGRPTRVRRRSALVLTACVVAAVVALAPPFGLAGRVVDAFRDEGKPVPVSSLTELDRDALVFMFCNRLELATPRGGRPERRCLDGNPRIEEIANNGNRLYWRVTFPDGRTCLASGLVRARRDTFGRGRSRIGSIGCPARLPTEQRPITTGDMAISISAGSNRARILHARGLAAPGVAEVGLVDEEGDVWKEPVEDQMYEISEPPDRAWVAIAAYDEAGEELHRERLRLVGPRAPPTRIDRNVPPPPPPPPPPLPRAAPVQSAETADARVDVYRSGFVRVRLKSTTSRAYELIRPRTGDRRVPISCYDLAYGAGAWESIGSGAYGSFGLEMRTVVTGPRGSGALTPPVDACSVRGVYGRRWNDWRGTHDAIEVAFTPLGERFFAEQAAARDLSLFVRTPALREIRDRMRQGVPAPTARTIATRYPSRVVALDHRRAVLPPGQIGVWSDERDVIVATTQATDGRRLYVELRSGRVGPHNLGSIGFVF
jgi:hypothetical protein